MHFVDENIKPCKTGFANKPSRGCNPSRPANGRCYIVFVTKSKGQFWSLTSWKKSEGVIQYLSVIRPRKRHHQVNKIHMDKIHNWRSDTSCLAVEHNCETAAGGPERKAHLPLLLCLMQMCSQLELTVLLVCARHFFQSQYFLRNNVKCDW